MRKQIFYFLAVITLFLHTSCNNGGQTEKETSFVFVPGAYHGKWCWDQIIANLVEDGYKAVAIDLPAHGNDTTKISNVSLSLYIDKVVGVINELDKPVILVGHSAGGMTISGVAERIPEQIKALIFVSAVIPQDSETLLSVKDPNPSGIQFYEISDDGSYATVIPEMGEKVFYHDSKKDPSTYVERLNPEPIAPLTTPIELSQQRFGSVPRYFVECTQDRVLSIDLQKLWQQRSPCKQVYTMETGHLPFLAKPNEFTEIILNIANREEKKLITTYIAH